MINNSKKDNQYDKAQGYYRIKYFPCQTGNVVIETEETNTVSIYLHLRPYTTVFLPSWIIPSSIRKNVYSIPMGILLVSIHSASDHPGAG